MLKQHQIEEELRHRIEFETFLANLSATFIGLPEDSVDVNMERGLAYVGTFLQMDRVTVLELSQDCEEMTVRYSWSLDARVNAAPQIARRTQPWWFGQVLRGEVSLAS